MPAESDRDTLAELQAFLLAHNRPPLAQTEPPLILPVWSTAYALNRRGEVVGIKIGNAPRPQELFSLILRFNHLERLVFFPSEPFNIPTRLAHLSHLRFLYFGDNLHRFPPSLLDLKLPITVIDPKTETEPGALMDLLHQINGRIDEELQRSEQSTPTPTHLGEQLTPPDLDLSARREYRMAALVRGDLAQVPSLSRELATQSVKELQLLTQRILSVEGIFLDHPSTLEDPPVEIAAKGNIALARYFDERRAGDLPLNELKIILVGNGSSGKTSLVKRMFGDAFNSNEPQTHGINIRRSTFTSEDSLPIKLNFWDFGGQEIMHATHQFFLSKRSFYILVLDGRKEEDAEYWLQHIESFGGDSPIMIVLNKIDENPAFELNRRFLRQKYPGIVDFARLSCATGVGVADFKAKLYSELGRVPSIQTRWPANWFKVKERLETLPTSYISLADYNQICDEEGVIDPETRETLVDFLHDLGVILHFRELQLLDTHVLDPRWFEKELAQPQQRQDDQAAYHACRQELAK